MTNLLISCVFCGTIWAGFQLAFRMFETHFKIAAYLFYASWILLSYFLFIYLIPWAWPAFFIVGLISSALLYEKLLEDDEDDP